MRVTSLTWQKILAQGFASAGELLQFLGLPASLGSIDAEKQFKTRVPKDFAARMQHGNPNDPLLLQVLASVAELTNTAGFNHDPLKESQANLLTGLIHKYQGRVLLTVTGTCAINCRYCFRRHFPYQHNNPGRLGWQGVIDYIKKDKSIHEVILSGGDPLLAVDATLRYLLNAMDDIPHLQTLRIHSRIPIVLPERLNQSLLTILTSTRLNKVMVIHCNHAQEINATVKNGFDALRAVGYHLLNQSVLLKGINDCATVLAQLSTVLFACGVLPYYLHLVDKVAGAEHFDLPEVKALFIYRQLQTMLPGYLLPRLAREEAGKGSKTLLV